MANQTARTRPRRIVIAGASGMIGRALAERLTAGGDEVVRLVRKPARGSGEARWDPAAGILDPAVLSGADAVVGLSGASTGRLPWTRAYREVVITSRLDATRTLVDAMRAADRAPGVFVSASAVGFYGDRGDEDLAESSAPGSGFLPALCRAWEREAGEASELTRVATVRTGLVVGPGTAMRALHMLARAGLAGPLGSGRQWWPWISLRDEVVAIDHVIGAGDDGLNGPVNLAGPTPATQADVMRTLARLVGRPFGMPVPAFALRLALGDAADAMLLGSQRVIPEKLLADGFRFNDETPESALAAYLDEVG